MPSMHCVSQGNGDDKGIRRSHRKEPDIRMSATFSLRPALSQPSIIVVERLIRG
jgi:hypothetical protein